MTTVTERNIIQKYSINIFTIKFESKKKKVNLIENLWKYMIKSTKKEKENLSTNIDEILYGWK